MNLNETVVIHIHISAIKTNNETSSLLKPIMRPVCY